MSEHDYLANEPLPDDERDMDELIANIKIIGECFVRVGEIFDELVEKVRREQDGG